LSNAIQQILGNSKPRVKTICSKFTTGENSSNKALPGFVTDISLAALGGKIPQAATVG
jgi:hypothetical protein